MKHPCNAGCTTELASSTKLNTNEQPSVFFEFGEAKIWVFHPLDNDC